ncbi:MAG: hypothetical protein RIR26_969 [Pseudomonadota bacterium]
MTANFFTHMEERGLIAQTNDAAGLAEALANASQKSPRSSMWVKKFAVMVECSLVVCRSCRPSSIGSGVYQSRSQVAMVEAHLNAAEIWSGERCVI